MRHRAQRSLLHRLTVPGPARRGVLAVAALMVAGTLTGVGVAIQDDAEPSAAGSAAPTLPDAPTPTTLPPVEDTPSARVSRGHKRGPVTPSGTPTPSEATSAAAAPSTTVPPSPTTPGTPGTPSDPRPSPAQPVDDSAPQTSASTAATDSDSWTVSVGADETSSYECSLDGGSFQSCGSAVTYGDLDRGRHTFAARATDEAGNTDTSPAELTANITGPR